MKSIEEFWHEDIDKMCQAQKGEVFGSFLEMLALIENSEGLPRSVHEALEKAVNFRKNPNMKSIEEFWIEDIEKMCEVQKSGVFGAFLAMLVLIENSEGLPRSVHEALEKTVNFRK